MKETRALAAAARRKARGRGRGAKTKLKGRPQALRNWPTGARRCQSRSSSASRARRSPTGWCHCGTETRGRSALASQAARSPDPRARVSGAWLPARRPRATATPSRLNSTCCSRARAGCASATRFSRSPLSAVLVEPDTVRQLFNDTDADARCGWSWAPVRSGQHPSDDRRAAALPVPRRT